MTRWLIAPPAAQERPVGIGEESPALDAPLASTLETLSWLLRYPLLRASDLATLMGLSASATAARLARVHADGYVRSVSASLLGRHVARLHALTPIGLACLADHAGPIVWERARRSQADAAGLLKLMSDLPCTLVTQSIVLALIAHAEASLCQQASHYLMWSWTRAVRLRPLRTGGDSQASSLSKRGDAGVGLSFRVAAHDTSNDLVDLVSPADADAVIFYRFIIVWDSGLSQAHDIRRQLLSFLRIRDSYERQGRLATFPTLLVVTPDMQRVALWQAQALRLATERWLTHPLLGGALALNDSAHRGACGTIDEDVPSLPFPPTTVDTLNPWQAAWRSFAQPDTQLLSDLLHTGSDVGGRRRHAAASEQNARSFTRYQAPHRTRHAHDQVEMVRLTLRLDAHSLRLLTALYLHPLLSTQHLAAVLEVQTASAERTLRHLRRLDLVQMQKWSGVQYGMLSDLGVVLLARCAHLPGATRTFAQAGSQPPRVLRRYQCEVRALARTPDHTEGVYSFFTALLQTCAVERGCGHDATLLWWETGNVCARAFHDSGGWRTIRPDGAGEWRVEGQRFSFWLEWDRGTMGPRDLTAKFAAYARYLQSGEWRVDGDDPLPALLIVTSDVPQEARLLDALDATLPESRSFAVYLTQRDNLEAHGPLAPIWCRYEHKMGRVQWSIPSSLLSDSPMPQVSARLCPSSQSVRYTAGQGTCSACVVRVGCGCGMQGLPEQHGQGRRSDA